MNHEILELLPPNQKEIIRRAARLVKGPLREEYFKHVADQLRPLRDAPDNTTIRHFCGSAICKYGKRI
jgi:hypothetical protein